MVSPYTRITGLPSTVIRNSDGLAALSHPLRMRLISLLRRHGPSTASGLAREVDESSGSTSYHLRQLARFDLVELDPEQPNRRDKLWRAVTDSTDVDLEALVDDPVALAAVDRLVQLQVQRFAKHASEATRLSPELMSEWAPSMLSSDATLRMTPAMLGALRDELLALVGRYNALSEALPADEPQALRVSVFAGGVPISGEGTDW